MKNSSFALYRDHYMVIEMRGTILGSDQDVIPLQQYKDVVAEYIGECQGKQIMPRIIIDLGKVTYINSTGIAALVKMHMDVTHSKGKIILAGINENIVNIFVITKLTMVFDIASMEEAEQRIEQ